MHNRQRKLSMWVLLSLCEKKRNHDVTIVYLTYSKINEQYSVTFHDPRVTTGLLLRKQAWSIKKYIIWHNDRYFLAEKTAKPPSRAKKALSWSSGRQSQREFCSYFPFEKRDIRSSQSSVFTTIREMIANVYFLDKKQLQHAVSHWCHSLKVVTVQPLFRPWSLDLCKPRQYLPWSFDWGPQTLCVRVWRFLFFKRQHDFK